MKVHELLSQPGVWVPYPPRNPNQQCLLTAVHTCYANRGSEVLSRIHKQTGYDVGRWNDTHSKEEVLALAKELDI